MGRSSVALFFLLIGIAAAGIVQGAPPSPPPVAAPSEEAFVYNRAGKPDPFRPFIDLTVDRKKLEEELKKKRALQASMLPLVSMPLESFRLVGIAGNERKRVAIVIDPSGKFYPLQVGMVIGESRARIISIKEKKLILEEKNPGQRKARRVEWELKSAEEEGKP